MRLHPEEDILSSSRRNCNQVNSSRFSLRERRQLVMEVDSIKGSLQRIDEQRKLQALAGTPLSTSRSNAIGTEM